MSGSICGYLVRADSLEPIMGFPVKGSVEDRRLDDGVRGLADEGRESPFEAMTDGEGRFTANDLGEGGWMLEVRSPSGEVVARKMVLVFHDAVSEVTLEVGSQSSLHLPLPPSKSGCRKNSEQTQERLMTGSLRGQVVLGEAGGPLADASITVVSGPGAAPDFAPITDRGGWFVLNDLASGTWRLGALGPNGEKGEATVRVFSNATAHVTIEVEARGNPVMSSN